jgi:hypothetical protein
MTTKKITSEETSALAVESLPTRPTESTAFGGKGYTSTEMKAAFDRLPKLIIERFNHLIDDIEDGSILEDIKTKNENMPSVSDLIDGMKDERLATAITVFGTSLKLVLHNLREDVNMLMKAIGIVREADE